MTLDEQKQQMREQARIRRAALAEDERAGAQNAIAARLLSLPAIKQARTIGVYKAYGSELSLDSFVKALHAAEGGRVAYPLVVSETAMVFLYVGATDDMTPFANPAAIATSYDASKLIPASELDLVLLPGLAFDKNCNRLGQGGGYYDRYLPLLRPDCITVGIAFDEQIAGEVPTDDTDRRVDYVLTPTQIYAA